MFKTIALSTALICTAQTTLADQMDDIVSVDVIPGWQTQSGSQMAGLRISLAPGWKTYWRAPGDGGIPPVISFAGSDNIATSRMQWPTPDVFYQGDMRSVGYSDQVIVPVELMPLTPGADMTLSGEMQIGVCEEICVPAHLTFEAVIPPGGERAPALVAALVDRPLTAKEAGVAAATCSFAPIDGGGVMISAAVTVPHTGGREEVIIEAGDPYVWVSEPEVTRSGNHISATSKMMHSSGTSFALDRTAIRITILGQDHAVDVKGCTAN